MSIRSRELWEHVARQQGDIFYAHWAAAAASSDSITSMSIFTTHETQDSASQLWAQALNTLAALYYAQEGWKSTSTFQVPMAWRNESITNMLERLLRTSHPGYGSTLMHNRQDRMQLKLPNGPPEEDIVLLHRAHTMTARWDGPGKSQPSSSTGMLKGKAARTTPYQVAQSRTMIAGGSMLHCDAAPLRTLPQSHQNYLQTPDYQYEEIKQEGNEDLGNVFSQDAMGVIDLVEMPAKKRSHKKKKVPKIQTGLPKRKQKPNPVGLPQKHFLVKHEDTDDRHEAPEHEIDAALGH
jgi:hypothetical protein